MYEYMYGYHLFDMATPHSIQRGEGRLAQLRVRRVRADAAGYNLRHTYTYIHTLKSVCAMRYCQLLIAISSSKQDFFACMNVYILMCARTGRLSAAEDAAHVEGGAKIVQHEHHRILSTATATIPAFLVQTVGLDHSSLGSGWRQLA